MSSLPRSPDFMTPPSRDHCRRCGEPAAGRAAWSVQHPEWEHEECRDWSDAAFPFEWKLRRLRMLARFLRQAYARTVDTGMYLKNIRQRWPNDASKGLEALGEYEKV